MPAEVFRESSTSAPKIDGKIVPTNLRVEFGPLSERQFATLRGHFGSQSLVTYDPRRHYDLVDFLPPAIQALVGRSFVPEATKIPAFKSYAAGEGTSVLSSLGHFGYFSGSNCWATTLAFLPYFVKSLDQSPHPFTMEIFIPGRMEITDALNKNTFSEVVPKSNIRLGDILLVEQRASAQNPYMIMHTAIVLTDDLVFEKTGTRSADIYRIASRESVERDYANVFGTLDHRFVYRRYSAMPDINSLKAEIDPDLGSEKDHLAASLKPGTRLLKGCEVAVDGTCEIFVSVLETLTFRIDPRSGRGMIDSGNRMLPRLPLRISPAFP